MTQPFYDAALDLLQGRANALKSEIAKLSDRYDDLTESGLARAITDADHKKRPLLGLLLSEKVLRRAISNQSTSNLQDFVFRLAAHLKASVSLPGLAAEDRVVLATAALQLFKSRTGMTRQITETEQILDRLPDRGDGAPAWKRQLRMTEDDFATRVVLLSSAWHEIEAVRFQPDVPVRRPARLIDVQEASAAPNWLQFEPGEPSYLVGSRNWTELDPTGTTTIDLERAWSCFELGEFEEATVELWPIYALVGDLWSPGATPDGNRAWNFLRLLWFLSCESQGLLANRRRCLVSAAEAVTRAVPESEDLLHWLCDQALRDYVAADPAMEAEWAVHSARLVAVTGADALNGYTDEMKALLRAAWEARFSDVVSGMRQTRPMVDALASEFRFRRKELSLAAEPDGLVQRRITPPLRRIEMFLDREEARIAKLTRSLAADVIAYLAKDAPSPSDGRSLIVRCDQLSMILINSESLLLQDSIGPAVVAMRTSCNSRDNEHKSGSRPTLTAQLSQNRFPLSSAVAAPFAIEVVIRNDGNSSAELVEVLLESLAVEIKDPQQVVARVRPGAEHTISFEAVSVADAAIAQLSLDMSWRDQLEQTFHGHFELRAEDQRPSSWNADDASPFKFSAISVPAKLVGRGDDLDALERTMAGGGSAAVTGLKRVGKSSLAKTHLTKMRADGWGTAYLPLGQVLSGTPSAAQFASALIETIFDAVQAADIEIALPDPPDLTDDNFARVAGRWMRRAGSVLTTSDAHVLIAIDDFDELPEVLFRGLEADALFLFIRSIIDEPWLSLMFIGSEVLPSIIEAQAHKLNQVLPMVVSNFSSVNSTRQLLAESTKSTLEWNGMALDRAHFVTAGNPYYLTLLGRELWQTLRDLDRTYVAVGDIDDALKRIAASGSLTHFVHLWADSVTGIDGKSRPSLMSAALLRAVAQTSGTDYSFVSEHDIHELTLNWVPNMSEAEFGSTLAVLVARTVLLAKDQTYRLSIPLGSAWLQVEGARELDKQFSAARAERSRVRRFANLDLLRLTRNLTFCGESITEVRLSGWLEQFPEADRYLAFLLAKRTLEEGFYSNTRIVQEILPLLKEGITQTRAWASRVTDANGYAKNVFFLSHGLAGSSSHGVASNLAKLLKVKKANIVDVPGFLKATKNVNMTCSLIIADDFVGSGKQLTGVVTQTLGNFAELTGAWRENLHVVVAAGLAATDLAIEIADVEVETVIGQTVPVRLFALSDSANIFDDADDLEAAAALIDGIGQSLSPGRIRGFGDLGLLVVLEQNCPNNSLPILWKAGLHAGAPWLPLFERRL